MTNKQIDKIMNKAHEFNLEKSRSHSSLTTYLIEAEITLSICGTLFPIFLSANPEPYLSNLLTPSAIHRRQQLSLSRVNLAFLDTLLKNRKN